MLSIGEFSNICKVSAKTLRYYAEIGLLPPAEVNLENGYRYYAIDQLETMLFINRLKAYNFSLEEIKLILGTQRTGKEALFMALTRKKKEIEEQERKLKHTLEQLDKDILSLKRGKSIMSYLEGIDTQLVEVPKMHLLFIRKMVHERDYPKEYETCFCNLFEKIDKDKLTVQAPPMVLFHSSEYTSLGLDTEFAIPVKEYVKGTRDFSPGLCVKTVLCGSYSGLPSVYAKQREWAEREGYESSNALYEVYITDPSQVSEESELITEVYYPVKKKMS